MKNRDVFSLAMALLSESGDRYALSDYEERAGYLIPSFRIETRTLSEGLSEREGRGVSSAEIPLYVSMDEELPVCAELVPAAAYYLAAMLVLADDPELSDTLFGRYCDAVSAIADTLPARVERIISRYGD